MNSFRTSTFATNSRKDDGLETTNQRRVRKKQKCETVLPQQDRHQSLQNVQSILESLKSEVTQRPNWRMIQKEFIVDQGVWIMEDMDAQELRAVQAKRQDVEV